ncbi:MAG: hypothetical protein A4E46_01593 [Methanosaeta sp. PtaU1.Bin016]|nr:MAG: hypothetical protein A4E46_01593 [Methanosaeta sp. PtaU1.Bin016]
MGDASRRREGRRSPIDGLQRQDGDNWSSVRQRRSLRSAKERLCRRSMRRPGLSHSARSRGASATSVSGYLPLDRGGLWSGCHGPRGDARKHGISAGKVCGPFWKLLSGHCCGRHSIPLHLQLRQSTGGYYRQEAELLCDRRPHADCHDRLGNLWRPKGAGGQHRRLQPEQGVRKGQGACPRACDLRSPREDQHGRGVEARGTHPGRYTLREDP